MITIIICIVKYQITFPKMLISPSSPRRGSHQQIKVAINIYYLIYTVYYIYPTQYIIIKKMKINIEADDFYSVLSHPMRLRALVLIKQFDELCVCELTHALALAQPVISRHLAQLKEAGLLVSRRQGLWIYYRIHSELPEWINKVIETTVMGIAERSPYKDDRLALSTMKNRPNQTCC